MKRAPVLEQEESQHGRMALEESEHSSELVDQAQQLNFVPKAKRKQSMYITYRGIIQTASIHFSHSLTLLYTTVIAENWKLSNGQKSGISQNASQNGRQLVWNFPFQMTFQLHDNPEGWPQLVIVLYGRDFWGRSVAKGYGNMHLPVGAGSHVRKLRVFDTIPPTNTATCCALMMGYINELKQPEKVLVEGGRQFLQTKPIGEITIRVEVRRYNFQQKGYQ